MSKFSYLWAKTADYHPLPLHLLDVAVCADAILQREPEATRARMANILSLNWPEARPWLLLIIACHDIGKACPGFQLKWKESEDLLLKAGFHVPRMPETDINHGFVSQFVLDKLLFERGWPEELAARSTDAVGCHHGVRSTPTKIQKIEGDSDRVDGKNWSSIWTELFNTLCEVFHVGDCPKKSDLSGPDFMLLSGLTSFADWIGSNTEWFPFGTVQDCDNLSGWLERRHKNSERALDELGWNFRTPLTEKPRSFAEVFPECRPPRPLQEAVAKSVKEIQGGSVILIEAPMGEGKTEAAFYAHLELQRRFGHRGLYIAMPTKATGNAMFTRTLKFLRGFADDRTLDLQLLHGAVLLNDVFRKMITSQIHSEEGDGAIQASCWFTHKKRALLSEYGVGTIDQALLTILPVRHYFVRLWGLANRVVVFDEIHAYDAYTGTLLLHLIRWLRSLGSSVILLSATLPPAFRRRLAQVLGAEQPVQEVSYPRLTVFEKGNCTQIPFNADEKRRRELCVKALDSTLESIKRCIDEEMCDNGYAGIIVNTVQRAQGLYLLFGEGEKILQNGVVVGKRLADETEIYLFHARYPAQERQQREDAILALYGKNEENGEMLERSGRHILIATQVAEQSLDLDFDLLVSDLAPIDLVLQRAGRIWRHARKTRPTITPCLCISGLTGDTPGSFGDPLWWNAIYREDILLQSWNVLKQTVDSGRIALPDQIDQLVKDVYDKLSIPDDKEIEKEMRERMLKAELDSQGREYAEQIAAHQAIIGLPEDASWKDTSRFYLYDDDEPGVHPILKALTRLGDDSVTAIPIFTMDSFDSSLNPEFVTAKEWALRSVSISRKDVVKRLRIAGIPEGWKKSPLLRNSYTMIFDKDFHWKEDSNVVLDKELGIFYIPKEA